MTQYPVNNTAMEKLTAEPTRTIRRRFSAGILASSTLNAWLPNILHTMNALNTDPYGTVASIADLFSRTGVHTKTKRCNAPS